jgi:hypothetical protein
LAIILRVSSDITDAELEATRYRYHGQQVVSMLLRDDYVSDSSLSDDSECVSEKPTCVSFFLLIGVNVFVSFKSS